MNLIPVLLCGGSGTPAFQQAIAAGVPHARDGRFVTFGIVPEHPETGYGYIRRGAPLAGDHTLDRLVEKPDATTAQSYLDTGEYYWNSGIFLFRADSIDYALLEKISDGVVIPLAAGWNDIGVWDTLCRSASADFSDNTRSGDTIAHDCTNSLIHAQNTGSSSRASQKSPRAKIPCNLEKMNPPTFPSASSIASKIPARSTSNSSKSSPSPISAKMISSAWKTLMEDKNRAVIVR